MNYLLFGGAESVGKSEAIKRLEQYFIQQKGFRQIGLQDLPNNDFYACVEGRNNAGKEIRILLFSAADTKRVIRDFERFCTQYAPYDFIVSTIRDEGDLMRDYFYDTMGITDDADYVSEISMGKITRRNTRDIAVKWYSERVDTFAHTILQYPPFSL
jgi:hypothetical protein